MFDGVTEAVERADSGIAAPREGERIGATGANHLVVDHVRRHAYQREMASTLADNLMAGRKRNQMGEPLQSHTLAILHERSHSFR